MKTLSRKAKYALRALQYLARERRKGPVLAGDLAREEGIPRKFLEAILLQLRNEGVLESKRGKGGGYVIRDDPSHLMIGRVVRIFDGPLAPLSCVSESAFSKCGDCPDLETCGTRLVMREVRDAIAHILDQTSLQDLSRRTEILLEKRARETMYHI
jgi:Rrf2 family protein